MISSGNAKSTSNPSTKLWTKVKSGTKCISTSFQNLSMKSEHDGDSVTSTVIHKALVRYYAKREPFQGFPGWLGHKSELPDEQKLLETQVKNRTEASTIRNRDEFETKTNALSHEQDRLHTRSESIQRITPGSSVFRRIVSSSEITRTTEKTKDILSFQRTEKNKDVSLSSVNDSHELFSQRLMLNRMRLKRVDTSTSLKSGQ